MNADQLKEYLKSDNGMIHLEIKRATYYGDIARIACCVYDGGRPLLLGRLWFTANRRGTMEVLMMQTDSRFRKCGVMGWLFNQILERYTGVKRIVTSSDTPASRNWLASRGFVRNANGDLEMRRDAIPA